VIKEKVAI